MVIVEGVRIGGRIFRRERSDGKGNMLEGAKDTGSSISWARSEGLWSRSLSLFGSYEPSPMTLLSAWCMRVGLCKVWFHKYIANRVGRHTFKVGS